MNKLLLLLWLALAPLTLLAQRQTTAALAAQRQAAQIEIERIDAELKKLEGPKRDASQQLKLTKERLSKRREVLRSIDAQISILDDRAREQSAIATAHGASLDSMYNIYKLTVIRLYEQRHQSQDCGLLLSSTALSGSVHRAHMSTVLLRAIENRRNEIHSLQGELGLELRQIADRKEQLALLKVDEAEATAQIEREKAKVERLTASIAKDEKSLTKEKERRIKLIASVQKQIEAAIRREVEASNKSASATKKPQVKESDPASRAFVAAKGRLFAPISPAKIVDTYGVHAHPSQRGVKVDNKGVNIESTAGASVRAVAKGEIRKIFVVTGMGTSVLVRHGAYLTVYSNLSGVKVSVGDAVEQGSVLGVVAEDGILHFELWRETQTLDPEDWIKF